MKLPMKATEKAVDIVSDISKNPSRNVCSEVLGKVVPANIEFVNYSGLKFSQIFRAHRSSHCKNVFCKKKCSLNLPNLAR